MKKRIFSVLYMFAITFVFTAMVSGIYAVNEERIAVNEKVKLSRIILRVLKIEVPPHAPDAEILAVFDKRISKTTQGDRYYYRGVAQDGMTAVGYAFPLEGPGLWGPIYGMMGVDADLRKVLGVAFYAHTETPGLGGRITEDWFVKQFEGKQLKPMEPADKYFSLVKQGKSTRPNEVDGITGASITSTSVERFMNKDIHLYLPLIAQAESIKVSSR